MGFVRVIVVNILSFDICTGDDELPSHAAKDMGEYGLPSPVPSHAAKDMGECGLPSQVTHSEEFIMARKDGLRELRKTLEVTKRRREEFEKRDEESWKEQERKDIKTLNEKKENVRKETRALIAATSGSTLACPDCLEVKQRGGGLISHRTTYCKAKKF